jgi:hypothetical protein
VCFSSRMFCVEDMDATPEAKMTNLPIANKDEADLIGEQPPSGYADQMDNPRTDPSTQHGDSGEMPRQYRRQLYSAPRRFDLATIFVVTAAYSLLLGSLSALRVWPVITLGIAGFISFVGIGQALLFRGRKPRLASILVGAALIGLTTLAIWLYNILFISLADTLYATAVYTIFGALFGYLAGGLIGGVFLLADVLRRRFRRYARDSNHVTSDGT